MNLTEYAEMEMKAQGLHEKDADYGGMLYDSVMELVKVFAGQGHSGASASMVLQLFSKVAAFKPLSPLTGKDDEWMETGQGVFQNKRNYAVFKEGKDGRAYFLDALVWITPTGTSYTGSTKDGISSRQFIKAFPFTPVTFRIPVDEREVAKDDWEFTVKNVADIEAAREVYDIPQLV